jgi:hypothetical protein
VPSSDEGGTEAARALRALAICGVITWASLGLEDRQSAQQTGHGGSREALHDEQMTNASPINASCHHEMRETDVTIARCGCSCTCPAQRPRSLTRRLDRKRRSRAGRFPPHLTDATRAGPLQRAVRTDDEAERRNSLGLDRWPPRRRRNSQLADASIDGVAARATSAADHSGVSSSTHCSIKAKSSALTQPVSPGSPPSQPTLPEPDSGMPPDSISSTMSSARSTASS